MKIESFEDLKNIKAKDIMDEDFVMNLETDTIKIVSKSIIDANASESIIIDKSSNRVKGIVTLRDIVSAVAKEIKYEESISVIMTTSLIVASENDSLEDVLVKMAKHNIARIPVVSENHEIVGLITEKKLLKLIPGLYEVLVEELEINDVPLIQEEEKTSEGICEMCGNYSDVLHYVDGKWICEECLEDLS